MGEGRETHALFLLRVAAGRQASVLQCALELRAVRHAAASGVRELLLLAAAGDAGGLGRAAQALMELDGVEAVDCAALQAEVAAPLPAGASYL